MKRGMQHLLFHLSRLDARPRLSANSRWFQYAVAGGAIDGAGEGVDTRGGRRGGGCGGPVALLYKLCVAGDGRGGRRGRGGKARGSARETRYGSRETATWDPHPSEPLAVTRP